MVLYPTGPGACPISVTVGDLNNNNQLDIAVVLIGVNNVSVFLGNETGIFGMFRKYFIGKVSNPFVVVPAYFNRDNHLDIYFTVV